MPRKVRSMIGKVVVKFHTKLKTETIYRKWILFTPSITYDLSYHVFQKLNYY